MRRLVVFLSVVACLSAIGAAHAQTPNKPAASKTSTQKPATAAPDKRPRFRRDDMPAPVVNAPAAPAAKKRTARKPASAASPQTAAQGSRSSPRDAVACAQVNDPDAAIAGCTRVIEGQKQKPKARASAHYNRGNAHAAKGEHAAAISDYDEALKLDPQGAPAYNNRGSARNEAGDADGALADFSEAIKLNKRFDSAYFNRANVYAAKGDMDRAIADYTDALRHNRRNVNAYIARGALHLASGAVPKARADMALAARLDRKNAYAVLWQDIVERRAKGKSALVRNAKGLDLRAWPGPVVRLFTGEIKQEALLSAADDANPTQKQAHACEANFYGAQYALIEGQREDAARLFEAAAKDCPHGFLEGIAAAAELKGMGQRVGAN